MAEEKKYWNEEMETMPLNKLKELQDERLQAVVAYAYEKTVFYRRKFDEGGVKPSDINSVDDLKKLPLTTDTEIRQAPMEEKLAVPWEEIKGCCSSAGTTGFPELVPFIPSDFAIGCVESLCRGKWAMGLRPNDVIQNLVGFSCQDQINEALGATIIRGHIGRGNLDHQIGLANMMNVTVLEQMPSLILPYFDRAKELGIDISKSKIRLIFSYGEGWAESYKKKLKAEYGVTMRSLYGSTQVAELAYECEYGGGMHIVADCCLAEIIDPDTGEILGPGEEGELVATNFFRRAVPRIRVRMSDITNLVPYEPCPCGRTAPKIAMIRGRKAQLINVRGKTFFPIDVEEVIGSIPELGWEYQIILETPGEQKRLKVRVEYRPEVKQLENLKKRVEEALYHALGVESEVELIPIGSIGRAMFKAQRIIPAYEKA